MSEVIKLSKEELDTLQEFKTKNDQIVLQLGQVDVQKAILEGQRGVILKTFSKNYFILANVPFSKLMFPSPYFS